MSRIKQEIEIRGMTCNACKTKVEKALYALDGIDKVDLDMETGIGIIEGAHMPSMESINHSLNAIGSYSISGMRNAESEISEELYTYKPLLLILAYILGVTVLLEIASGLFLWETWMPNFMAAFFIVFSFFKMLDLRGFADSYKSYDLPAKYIPGYAYLYPFLELGLGLAYIMFPDKALTHGITAFIMFVSLLGVVLAVTNKRKIQCACLGTVFNLPMSYVTIIEDTVMLLMAVLMLLKI